MNDAVLTWGGADLHSAVIIGLSHGYVSVLVIQIGFFRSSEPRYQDPKV